MPNEVNGEKIVNKWLEVKESEYAVGHDMPSLSGEKSVEIGVKNSGVRGNRMLIVSIPLKQTYEECDAVYRSFASSFTDCDSDGAVYRSLSTSPPVGKTRSAWVGIGSVFDEEEVRELDLEIDSTEAVLITQIDYNTVSIPSGNTTLQVDDDSIEFAIKDMNRQYSLCDEQCKLSQLPAMLHKMESKHFEEIQKTMDSLAKKAKKDPFEPQESALLAFV